MGVEMNENKKSFFQTIKNRKMLSKTFCKTVDIFLIRGTIKCVETGEPFSKQ